MRGSRRNDLRPHSGWTCIDNRQTMDAAQIHQLAIECNKENCIAMLCRIDCERLPIKSMECMCTVILMGNNQ